MPAKAFSIYARCLLMAFPRLLPSSAGCIARYNLIQLGNSFQLAVERDERSSGYDE